MVDIVGYEGLYAITPCGKVWSYRRNRFMKFAYDGWGYYRAALTKEGKTTFKYIHRLVAEAYIPNPSNYPQVNHKDEDKSNNRLSNLEWCTMRYNANYGTKVKRMLKNRKKETKK